MKSNAKKIVLLLTLLVVPFMVTGCGKNSSAKDVAVEMVTKLSKDDYKNMDDIFYQEKDSYFDEEAFKAAIQDKDLNISGNKTIKVREVGAEITDPETGYVKVEVEIAIDNNKIFNVDTIKVGNKWYVYEPDFYDGNVEIIVPKGATVKFNGKKLGKKNLKTKEEDFTVRYPDSYKSVKLEDVKMDVYRINNVIEGKYSVSVKASSSSKEVKDVVYTYGETVKKSDNYEYDTDYSDKTKSYTFKLSVTDKKVDAFVKNYVDTIYAKAANGSFDNVKSFFDEECEDYSDIKTYYGKLVDKATKSDGDYSYASDFKINDFEQKATYYYNDDNIVVMFEYELEYKMVYSSSSYDRDYDVKTILVLKKDSKGNYVITDGNNMFVY